MKNKAVLLVCACLVAGGILMAGCAKKEEKRLPVRPEKPAAQVEPQAEPQAEPEAEPQAEPQPAPETEQPGEEQPEVAPAEQPATEPAATE